MPPDDDRRPTLPERVEGPRVDLEIWHPDHEPGFSAAVVNSLDQLRPFMVWTAQEPLSPNSRLELIDERRREWAEGGDGHYTVMLDGQIIGAAGIHHRDRPGEIAIGYWIDTDHTGRGYATEVARLLGATALARPDIDSVNIHHERTNPASGRVAAKAGFVFAAQRPTPNPAPESDGIEWVWRAMTLPGFSIRAERPSDTDVIAALVEAAFDSPAEAGLVADIRASPQYRPELSLVAEIDGDDRTRQVIGHVMISGCSLRTPDGRDRSIVMLSPLAVDPAFHRHGVGGALVKEAVDRADAAGEPLVVLEGSSRYYPRFGFEPARDHGVILPLPDWAPPEAGQLIRLTNYEAKLSGTVIYPPAFDGLG